jgi:hypothetical protein
MSDAIQLGASPWIPHPNYSSCLEELETMRPQMRNSLRRISLTGCLGWGIFNVPRDGFLCLARARAPAATNSVRPSPRWCCHPRGGAAIPAVVRLTPPPLRPPSPRCHGEDPFRISPRALLQTSRSGAWPRTESMPRWRARWQEPHMVMRFPSRSSPP